MSRPTPDTTPSDDLADLPLRHPAPMPREVTIFVGRVDGAAVTVAATPRPPGHERRAAMHAASTGQPHAREAPTGRQPDAEWYRAGRPDAYGGATRNAHDIHTKDDLLRSEPENSPYRAFATYGPDEPAEPAEPGEWEEWEEGPVVRLRIAPAGPGISAATDLGADEVHRIIEHLLALDSARRSALLDAEASFAGQADPAGPGDEAGPFRPAARPGGADGTRITVITAEGTTAGGLRHALASVPAEARLRDFTSDTEVVLVFDEPS
ncbi:hypothetical protein MXD63_03695 [Frankia sp. Cpl3]|nr:hypothetical protein [Parafrankia colletiae]MCK9899183.1 hypothetical protein [Frankia sp. Cpl3]